MDDLSDALGIPKEITGERNIKRIMIAGTSRIAIRLAEQVSRRYKDVEIYIAAVIRILRSLIFLRISDNLVHYQI